MRTPHDLETRPLRFYGVHEATPGPAWQQVYDATWPAYRRWYLSDGADARPSLRQAHRQLARHMPELLPTWERLCDLAGGDELTARFLTMWDPPAVMPGCSQAVFQRGAPALVRNYDYDPDLCERVVMSTAWSGRRVLGMSDCLWGLLDGMNDDGLAVSLAYGGRPGSSPGFGIPLVVRYLLETATSVAEAEAALDGLPVSIAYNLTVLDRHGDAATLFVAPGEPVRSHADRVATNHRGEWPEWPAHARRYRSVERKAALSAAVVDASDVDAVARALLTPPLYNTEYSRGFGTVYTAVYRPEQGAVDYLWPGSTWRREFDSPDDTHVARLGVAAAGAGLVDGTSTPLDTGRMTSPEASGRVEELARQARDAVTALAELDDPAAFDELLGLSQLVGECLGVSARTLAAARSWAGVADHAGVTRQAAWSRWSHG